MDVQMGSDDALAVRKHGDFISRSRYQGSGEELLCMVVMVLVVVTRWWWWWWRRCQHGVFLSCTPRIEMRGSAV
jgi:hypothetical protein